jgi:thiamine-monophosphate kinase
MPPWVVAGPGDDAAVIEPERGQLDVLTTDALVDGVHFDLRFVPAQAAGHRALAVNLSDLAAMGAQPRAALLSLLLPPALDLDVLDRIVDGFLEEAARHRVALIGGNVTRTPGPLALDVTAIGSVRPRRVLTRAGARPGDDVYVTGTVGDAAVGLRMMRAGLSARANGCTERYAYPQPRVRAGMLLGRTRAASSCMDLSDGLADAVRQVASASGVGITVDAEKLPISEAARAWHREAGSDVLEDALSGGDDYELLFTVRPSQRGRLRGALRDFAGLPAAKIGTVTKAPDLLVRSGDSVHPLPEGYEHFRSTGTTSIAPQKDEAR